jgi:hypothetical protein
MTYGIIYLVVNKINGKKYIGQTQTPLEARIQRHYNRSKYQNTIFYQAIRKYGKSAFEWKIIDNANSADELDKKEIHWIIQHKTFVDWENSCGYNMTLGGDSNVLSEEARQKISDYAKSRVGEKHPRAKTIVQLTLSGKFVAEYATTVELEDKYGWKRSTINGCLKGRSDSAYGHRWFYKDIYIKHLAGEINLTLAYNGDYKGSRKPKPVIQLTLNKEFISEFPHAKAAGEAIGSKKGNTITACCRGKNLSSKGYIWMYADDYYNLIEQGKSIKTEEPYTRSNGQAIPVVQLTKHGEFLNEFPSAKSAAVSVGGKYGSAIIDCCKGRGLTYKGYKWMYAKEYYQKIKEGAEIKEVVYVKNSRPVIQLTLEGEFIKEFPSAVAGAKSLGRSDGTNISACCNGKKETYLGYKWVLASHYYNIMD